MAAGAAEGAADLEILRLVDVERIRGWVCDFQACVVVFVVVDIFAGETGNADVDSGLHDQYEFRAQRDRGAYIGRTTTRTIQHTTITYTHHHFFMCALYRWKSVGLAAGA